MKNRKDLLDKLIKIVNSFKDRKIGVIGDLMLDQYVFGDTDRVSPEAPVPVVLVKKENFVPGGAGNTANNIAVLGGKVYIVGIIGRDTAGQRLEEELQKRGVNTQGVIKDSRSPTIQKTRVISRGQHIVRIDKENYSEPTADEENKAIDFISANIRKWDALVFSDYAKGFLSKNLIQEIIDLAKKYNKFVIADTKPKQAFYFRGVSLVSPNLKEAKEFSGEEILERVGGEIQKKLDCNVLITQGADGMTLFEGKRIKHFSAKAKEVFDVSGAGDTVVGAFALAQAAGADLETAAIIANQAAGVAVSKVGTAIVSLEELRKNLMIEYKHR